MKKIIIAIIVFGAIGGGIYYFRASLFKPIVYKSQGSGATQEAIAEISSYQYTETYTNPNYKFSFKYPKEFKISEMPDVSGGTAILVQNIAKDLGVQILITPFEDVDFDLTADLIRQDIPDMKISEPQEVIIGSSRKGLAFVSDNEAFGGKSREVWFIYGGNLYQISTYSELDGLLKGIFGTWQFTK